MPKTVTPTEFAAHFIELYSRYPVGTASNNRHNDLNTLEFAYQSINRTTGREQGCSDELWALRNDIKAFMEKSQQAAADRKNLTPQQLQERLLENKELANKIMEGLGKIKEPERSEAYLDGDEDGIGYGKSLENIWDTPGKGKIALKSAGETRSASKWIEQFKKDFSERAKGQRNAAVSSMDVAVVLAARQLANATYGKRKNIDNTKLSETEIIAQAERLANDPKFQKFMDQNSPIDAKAFTSGRNHGGYLEKQFTDFLTKEGEADLQFDTNGRYKKIINDGLKAQAQQAEWVDVDGAQLKNEYNNERLQTSTPKEIEYKGYGDYFTKNIKNVEGTVSPLAHAAKMAAANDLSRRKPDDVFDRKVLNERANSFLKDPAFKLMTMDENVQKLLCEGKADKFAEEVEDFNRACRSTFNMVTDKFQPRGEIDGPLERLTAAAQNDKALKSIVDSYNKLKDSTLEEGKSEKQVAEVLNDIIKYQDKNANKLGQTAKNVDDTLRLLNETVKGSYLESLVNKQIKKLNEGRNLPPDHPQYLTKAKVEREGLEAADLKKRQRDLQDLLDGKEVEGYDVPKEHRGKEEDAPADENDPLNVAADYGKGKGQKLGGVPVA